MPLRYLTCSIVFMLIVKEASGTQNLLLNALLKDEPVRTSFGKLLHNLAKVNEDRLRSMKRETLLQDYVVNSRVLTTKDHGRSDGNAMNEDDANLSLQPFLKLEYEHPPTEVYGRYLTKSPLSGLEEPRVSKENERISRLEEPPRMLIENERIWRRELPTQAVMRSDWRRPCDKSSMRRCRYACRSAVRNVCTVYKCSRRAKKRFKTECKRSCRAKFLGSGRYSSGSDSDYSD